MNVRLTASAVGGISLAWAGVGLYILKLALEPLGEPDDAAILFVPILALAVVGVALAVRTTVFTRGVLRLGIFAAALAGASALNTVIVPFANYGPWTQADTVSWLLGCANMLVLALAARTLCRARPGQGER